MRAGYPGSWRSSFVADAIWFMSGAPVRSRIIHGKGGHHAAPARDGEAGEIAGLLRACAGRGRAVFLFGGDSSTIHVLRERAASAFPALRIAGICDADFAGPIDCAVLAHITAAQADVIISDLPDARFRLFRAQCSAAGLDGEWINRPGSFPNVIFGPRRRFLGLHVPTRRSRFGMAVTTGLQFARIILTQVLCRAVPQAKPARDAATVRRG